MGKSQSMDQSKQPPRNVYVYVCEICDTNTHAPADGDEGPVGRRGRLDDDGAAVAGAGGDVREGEERVEEGAVVHLFEWWWWWLDVGIHSGTVRNDTAGMCRQQDTHRLRPQVAGGVELVEEPPHLVALRLGQLRLRVAELVHLKFRLCSVFECDMYTCVLSFVSVVCICVDVYMFIYINRPHSQTPPPIINPAQRTIRRISGVWKRRQPFLALLAS